CATLTGIFDYW
nr:immunoglobulin heavy chain junction region [Mus musculus]